MILIVLSALAIFIVQCTMAMHYLIKHYREDWQLVNPYLETVRLRNRYVIGFEYALAWVFFFVWLLSGDESFYQLSIISFLCGILAILIQLLIKFLYHQIPQN